MWHAHAGVASGPKLADEAAKLTTEGTKPENPVKASGKLLCVKVEMPPGPAQPTTTQGHPLASISEVLQQHQPKT